MIELLSPAGNIESLKSAINNMADAVYLGLEHFNARIKADNFSTYNLKEWVEFCHLYTVKVYVTLNTLIKDEEINQVKECLIACKDAGVDALIITDLAVLDLCRKYAPNIPLHASTQLGIHNYLGAKFAERLGFKRIILSRETSIEDIKAIKKHTDLEIEYFIHGAMCVSFSGGCLLSSISSGNSGNRGLCLQPCRKLYSNSLTEETAYYLSPKDQCLIEHIDELILAGVDSFKIEGRLKSPEYVASVVKTYRKMLDCHIVSKNDIINMKKTFNRGNFSQGYAFSDKKDIMYKHNPSNIGILIGEIIDCRKNKKGFYNTIIKSTHKLSNGDGCKIIQGNSELGGFTVNLIKSTDNLYTLYTKEKFPAGANVHLTYDATLSKELNSVGRKINLKTEIILTKNQIEINTKIKTFYGEKDLIYKKDLDLDIAINNPLSEKELINQFSKCGDSPFTLYIYAKIYGEYFIPKSLLNQCRREYLKWLKKEIISSNKPQKINDGLPILPIVNTNKTSELIFEIGECLEIEKLNVGNSDLVVDITKIDSFIIKNQIINNNIYIKLPKLALFNDFEVILSKLNSLKNHKWFSGIYVDNIYGLEISYTQDINIIAGFGLNFLNSNSGKILGINNYCVSAELNTQEILKMNNNCIIYAYGYLPIMTLAHCPIINIYGNNCSNCKYQDFFFYDNYGKYRVNRTKIKNCTFTVRNSVCHNLLKEKNLNNFVKYIDLNCLEGILEGGVLENIKTYGYISCESKFTGGHCARGVK